MDDANELIGALVNGLWNSLTRHLKRTEPFRLTRMVAGSTRQELDDLALVRRQELEGFVEGLFNGQERVDLIRKASDALDALGDIRATMAGIHDLASDAAKPPSADDLAQTFKHVHGLRLIIEKGINNVVLDSTRARQMMKGGGSLPPMMMILH